MRFSEDGKEDFGAFADMSSLWERINMSLSVPGHDSPLMALVSQVRNRTGEETTPQYLAVFIWIRMFYGGLIILTGFLGNMYYVVNYIIWRTKGRNASAIEYLLGICIADLLSLCPFLHSYVLSITGAQISSQFWCAGIAFLSYLGCFLCTWFVVAFTFERLAVVMRPLRFQHRNMFVWRTRFILLAILVLGFVYNGWTLKGYHVEQHPYGFHMCTVSDDFSKFLRIFNAANMIVIFLIPMILITVMNTCIGKTLLDRRSGKFLRCSDTTIAPDYDSFSQGSVRSGQRLRHADRRASRNLIFASLCYLVFNCPHYSWRFSAEFRLVGKSVDLHDHNGLLGECLQLLLSTQYAVHCFTYARVAIVVARHVRRTKLYLLNHMAHMIPKSSRIRLSSNGSLPRRKAKSVTFARANVTTQGRSKSIPIFETVQRRWSKQSRPLPLVSADTETKNRCPGTSLIDKLSESPV